MRGIVLGVIALMSLAGESMAADTPAATNLIPAATFADQPFILQPLLSPDGLRIAARSTVEGKSKLIVFLIADLKATPRIFDVGDKKIADVNWAGPNRVLMTISTTLKLEGEDYPVTRLLGIDLTTGKAQYLDPRSNGFLAGDVLYTDPAGAWVLVSSQDDVFSTPSVKRIDLATGAVKAVEKQRPDVWTWYADNHGVVRAGIAYDEDRWTVWYREKPEDPLKPLRSKISKGDDKGAVDGLRFLAGDNSGMIITNAKTGRFGAYHYDFKTGVIGAAIFENPEVDLTSVFADPITGVVSGITYEDDRWHVSWLEPAMRTLQAKVEKALPNAEDVILNQSLDGNRMLIWSGSASDPGTYYLYDRAARRMDPIAMPYAKLDGVRLAPVAAIKYKARDGLTIPGYLTMPLDRPDHALPLIVMPHGGPFARDTWDYDPFVQFLASRGYVVLQPNFRGSTGYGKDYVEKGYGQWGRAMQDDVDDGVDWLIKSGKVDAKRVCIMGASYGGYAALWGAIRNPEKYRCAVSLSGVTDLPGMLRADRRSFNAPRYFRDWQSHVRGEDKKIDLDTVSPLAQAARLNVPVLIAHGEKDTTVQPKQAHQMVKALAGKPNVEALFYKDEGHGLTKKEDMADFLTHLDAFLAKHNPG
jgi:dipeptidyl aminopeptidase/acylaminoacyl peptidase